MPTESIEYIIQELDSIISIAQKEQNPLGYFAALYRKVTLKIKEGIQEGYFEDGQRMEKLDVIFAKRYIDAYHAFEKGQKTSLSWQESFKLKNKYWPIVLQHLLMGMNAHINLDLGIAAAQVSHPNPLKDLQNDFNKINAILASLIKDVETDLAEVWPTLKWILKFTYKFDDFLINFSMTLARDGAWRFAQKYHAATPDQQLKILQDRDLSVVKMTHLIQKPNFLIRLLFKPIRLGEKGNISQRISDLRN